MFKTPYDREVCEGLSFEDSPSMTQRQFADECDINTIISKYKVTGVLGDPFYDRSQNARYADVSDIPDIQSAQNAVCRANEFFDRLPSDVRAKFNNSPAEFFSAMSQPENLAEAVKYGVVEAKETTDQSVVQTGAKATQVGSTPTGDVKNASKQASKNAPDTGASKVSAPSEAQG